MCTICIASVESLQSCCEIRQLWDSATGERGRQERRLQSVSQSPQPQYADATYMLPWITFRASEAFFIACIVSALRFADSRVLTCISNCIRVPANRSSSVSFIFFRLRAAVAAIHSQRGRREKVWLKSWGSACRGAVAMVVCGVESGRIGSPHQDQVEEDAQDYSTTVSPRTFLRL